MTVSDWQQVAGGDRERRLERKVDKSSGRWSRCQSRTKEDSMAVAALDNNKVAARRQGHSEDECNNQIVLDYLRGLQALDNMTRGGEG